MSLRVVALAASLTAILSLTQVSVFPPESAPIVPSVQLFWMALSAPQLDLPSAPVGEPIDALLLCPNNVFSGQAECDNYAIGGQNGANTAYAADTANPSRVRIRGLFLANYAAPNNMDTELQGLQQNHLGQTAVSGTFPVVWTPASPVVDINVLRDLYRADRTTLVDNDPSSCGLGFMSASVYGKAWSFTIANKGCGIGNATLWHEWGHNDGLCHDTPNAAGCTPAKPGGFGLCDSAHGRRSPMTYPSPCGGIRTIFSNPLNTWTYGYPFGDADHDEASVQRWAHPIIANFYQALTGNPPANHQR